VIGVKEAIRTGTERGMLSFDSSLYNLVREGRIELEEALSSADSRTNLEAKINFG
jgi:twitching motility protein PilU